MKTLTDFSAQTGLPDDVWQSLDAEIKGSTRPKELIAEIRRQLPSVAELALEAGKYQLALNLGLERKFDQAKALLFLGRTAEVEKLLHDNSIPQEIASLIRLMQIRMGGKAADAFSIYQNVLKETQSCFAEVERLDLELQVGSTCFALSRYQEAFDFYKKAFETAEALNLKGKMAIAAFNAAVAVSYLQKDLEAKTWLWYSENILSNYHLQSLKLSVLLWKAEKTLGQGHFHHALMIAQDLVRHELSLVQKVLCLQVIAQSQTELGMVSEAEGTLAQSRSVINKNHFFQYEGFQQSLEQNLEVLLYRKIQRGSFVGKTDVAVDHRVLWRFKISQGRKAELSGDTDKVEKLVADLEKQDVISEIHFEDLRAAVSATLSEKLNTARAAQTTLLIAMRKKKNFWVRSLLADLSTDGKNPWKDFLALLANAYLLMAGDKEKAASLFSQAIVLAEEIGLERMVSVALGFAAFCDSHRQFDWFDHISTLDSGDRRWLQDFFQEVLGLNLTKGSWMIAANERRMVPQNMCPQGQFDLIIHENSGVVTFHGEDISLTGQSILFPILKTIVSSGWEGVEKESLVKEVWNYDYDPSSHDSLIYTNVRRLRDLVPIEMHQGRYRLSPEIKWCLVSQEDESSTLELSERQHKILRTLQTSSTISRKQVVATLNISERTALRELTLMVEKRLLIKQGHGRGVIYRLAESLHHAFGS